MRNNLLFGVAVGALSVALGSVVLQSARADDDDNRVKHVLLISIDGMHALDFANCANGVGGGQAYCPNLAELAEHGLTYTQTSTSRPSDSFPGLTALVTGGSPRSTGAFYDVSYDRSLSPPKVTTPYGIPGGAALCPTAVAQALEDDVALLWLNDNSPAATAAAAAQLEANAAIIGADGGEIFYGPNLDLLFNDPAVDPRTPNLIVAPNVGVVYTGGKKKIAEHGGFASDDRTVMMLVANPAFNPATINSPVETAQIAPTILVLLGLDPRALIAVQQEGTQVLPGVRLHPGF